MCQDYVLLLILIFSPLQNIYLVSFGTIAGHALCTGMAVLGGGYIAKRISIKHGKSIRMLFFFPSPL
jgi:putative Ca2+/H+ antiporter (TMEM165/GDT1 family)